jgi:pyruvate dehydrogenase E2 component (dihydrolipoyllysine-residue acetyltransferase)
VDELPSVAVEPQGDKQPTSAAGPDDGTAPTRIFASPLARRLAQTKGVDLSSVRGTGPSGRIVRRDIERVQGRPTEPSGVPTPAAASAGDAIGAPSGGSPSPLASQGGVEDVPHSGMRRAIARRLVESKTTIPHFYLRADCRMDALLELRRQINEASSVRISVNDLIVKAVAAAFREVPQANVIWTDESARRFDDVDIAVAVSVDDGLLTPVVRAADKRSLREVSAQIRDMAERARAGRIRQDEIEGGSFAVSNLGMYGTKEFAAIINPPHSGILAVGAVEQRPAVVDGELTIVRAMTVTLSADHRVLDGALAAQWLAVFVSKIESPLAILV